MVSIRRRRYLGLCTGKSSIPVELPKPADNGNTLENSNQNVKPFSVHPMPSDNLSLQKLDLGSDDKKPKTCKMAFFPLVDVKELNMHSNIGRPTKSYLYDNWIIYKLNCQCQALDTQNFDTYLLWLFLGSVKLYWFQIVKKINVSEALPGSSNASGSSSSKEEANNYYPVKGIKTLKRKGGPSGEPQKKTRTGESSQAVPALEPVVTAPSPVLSDEAASSAPVQQEEVMERKKKAVGKKVGRKVKSSEGEDLSQEQGSLDD
ncbi:hypothetical protein COCNU_15G004380 [Cocos nucifera]|uniref:Uncharacterized protein n=1 Tax=Cocos nucifera TaxID=13894 RepID=A0A8K0ND81_COCNU|nr:hypothetical protein COCNU_15G004380 [Cocos nucifera]